MLVLHAVWAAADTGELSDVALWAEGPAADSRPVARDSGGAPPMDSAARAASRASVAVLAPAPSGAPVDVRARAADGTAPTHPFALEHAALRPILTELELPPPFAATTVSLLLPSRGATAAARPIAPLASVGGAVGTAERVGLTTWRVPALVAPAGRTFLWLARLPSILWPRGDPLGALESAGGARPPADRPVLGADIRFWSAATRLALDLMAEGQIVPSLDRRAAGDFYAGWHPVLAGQADRRRLRQLVEAMPAACRAVVGPDGPHAPGAPPLELVKGYLRAVVDGLARLWLTEVAWPEARWMTRQEMPPPTARWLEALAGRAAAARLSARRSGALGADIAGWTSALTGARPTPFRLCLRLTAPVEDEAGPWQLDYLLQASDDPSLLVPAAEVWQTTGAVARLGGREVVEPQECLLAGLAGAAHLVAPIEASLAEACPTGALLSVEEAYRLLRDEIPALEESGVAVIAPPWWTRHGTRRRLAVRVRLAPAAGSAPAGGFGLEALVAYDWRLALGDEILTRQEFERLAAQKLPLVRVRGEWVELPTEDVERALRFWRGHPGTGEMPSAQALRLVLGGEATGLPIGAIESSGWVRDVLRQGVDFDRERAEPAGFVGELRPYQRRGYAWLAFMRAHGLGALLADSMGLGKTVQTIALLLDVRADGAAAAVSTAVLDAQRGTSADPLAASAPAHLSTPGADRTTLADPLDAQRTPADDRHDASATARFSTPGADRTALASLGAAPTADAAAPRPAGRPALLVCPTSVLGNWVRELRRFAPEIAVLVHHGPDRADAASFGSAADRHDVVLTTYALLNRDEARLGAREWSVVVLDEAQNIKNAGARSSRAARRLRGDFRLALTGTPIENRLGELWSILDFLNPGYLGSGEAFRRRFARPIEQGPPDAAEARLGELRRLIEPLILRRLKSDPTIVRDLPKKIEIKSYTPLTREQATLYEAVVQDMLGKIAATDGTERRGLVLATLTKLKQVCNHPAHFLGDGSGLADRSGKLSRLDELIEEAAASGDQTLVFTQFAEFGGRLRAYLQTRLGQKVPFLHGGTPAAERDRMVERFQSADGPSVFVLSLRAGGVGLNLTRANRVIHFDRWWNPAVEAQATDRAYRIGQTRAVQAYALISAGTLEERIDDLMESKRALSENVIGTGETWLTELSTEDLRALLTLRQAVIADG